ncbi:hypothetical protein CBL_09066 [Carabus blaptoides fortunei]
MKELKIMYLKLYSWVRVLRVLTNLRDKHVHQRHCQYTANSVTTPYYRTLWLCDFNGATIASQQSADILINLDFHLVPASGQEMRVL